MQTKSSLLTIALVYVRKYKFKRIALQFWQTREIDNHHGIRHTRSNQINRVGKAEEQNGGTKEQRV